MELINYLEKIIQKITDAPLKNLKYENQNKDYEGARFSIDTVTYRSRKAKITPKKLGYFVAFWEKDETNKNKPYNIVSAPNKLIVTVFDQEKIGQFIFPKEILAEKHILTKGSVKGKMALRVYPDWVTGLNKTASRTQQWQSLYFVDLTDVWDLKGLKQLYFG